MKQTHDIIIKRAIEWPSDFYGIPLALFGKRDLETNSIDFEQQLTIIQAGYHDASTVWILDSSNIAVLGVNTGLCYGGLEIFSPDFIKLGDVFLQGAEFDEISQLTDVEKIKTLLNFLDID